MSASMIARRVAIFTVCLSTAWMAATTAASALVPDPPSSGGQGTTHQAPATAGSGLDLTVWLLAAVAFAIVLVIATGVARGLHRRHLHAPAQTAH